MARWKASVQLPIRHNWTFSLALTVEALQGKTCQDSLLSGGVGHSEPRFQGEGVVPLYPLDYNICQVIKDRVYTKRRLIMLMSRSNELWGYGMRWNRLSFSRAKHFKCVFALAAVILNILRDFVLAALSVFVDDRDNRHCVSAKIAKQLQRRGKAPLSWKLFSIWWKLQNWLLLRILRCQSCLWESSTSGDGQKGEAVAGCPPWIRYWIRLAV